jgi:hypothetical protein
MTRKIVGIPIVTPTSVNTSPRRFRNSMKRVAIMPPVGIGDPRRSRDPATDVAAAEAGLVSGANVIAFLRAGS